MMNEHYRENASQKEKRNLSIYHRRWIGRILCCALVLILSISGACFANSADMSLLERGNFLYVQEKYDQAIEAYENFLKSESSVAHRDLASFFIGKCYEKLGKPEKAIEFFLRVEHISPQSAWVDDSLLACANCNLTLASEKKLDEAITQFSRIVDSFPDGDCVLSARFGLGQAYFKLGQWKNAEKNFLVITEAQPTDRLAVDTLFALGDFYRTHENSLYNISQSIASYEKIQRDFPKSAPFSSVYLALGNAQREAKQIDKAIATYQKILTDFPDSPQAPLAQSMIGLCHEDNDDLDKSMVAYQNVKKFNTPQLLKETISSRSKKLRRLHKKAMHIEADEINYQANEGKAWYNGHVAIFWDECDISAERAIASLHKSLFVLEGNVQCLSRKDLRLSATQAHLFPKENRVILYGEAKIIMIDPSTKEESVVAEGKKISYDFANDSYLIDE